MPTKIEIENTACLFSGFSGFAYYFRPSSSIFYGEFSQSTERFKSSCKKIKYDSDVINSALCRARYSFLSLINMLNAKKYGFLQVFVRTRD